jgi:CRISPR-associated protein Csy1
MLDPAIANFFEERKEAWLKKNIKVSMAESEIVEKKHECDQVFLLANWLPAAAKRAGQISMATHPCTFSHPSARKNKNGYVSSIIAQNAQKVDGLLRSGNVHVEPDALGNAAALDVHKFLSLVLSDSQTLLNHIVQESELAQKLLKQPNSDYAALRDGFLKMIEADQVAITSSKIKQVYYPVEDGEYHLLSILTNSGQLFELRKRLDKFRFGDDLKQARESRKANLYHATGYREIYGLTTIGYGGTKPQNISVLNNQNAGKAHLLPSFPPSLKQRDIRLPTSDFFKESFIPWHAKDILISLHKTFSTSYKDSVIPSRNLRTAVSNRFQEYIDLVIEKMWQVRVFLAENPSEPSSELPLEQKIWLYPQYQEQRELQSDWLDSIARHIARGLMNHYSKNKFINNPVLLADQELFAIERVVEDNKELLR